MSARRGRYRAGSDHRTRLSRRSLRRRTRPDSSPIGSRRYSTYAGSGNPPEAVLMPTEAEVLEALRPVEDPEIHQSIVDLNMVKGVAIEAGRVGVTVALTVAGCPLRAEITRRVTDAVVALDGVD